MTDYVQAAKFSSEATAKAAYTSIQTLLHENEDINDLHVYRAVIDGEWYVVVLGKQPAHRYHQAIKQALAQGTTVNLVKAYPHIITMLSERGETLNRTLPPGTWFEQHR